MNASTEDHMRKILREITADIEAEGGTVVDIEESKHHKVRFLNPQGVVCLLVAPKSPSDRRGNRNLRSDIRRLMRKGSGLAFYLPSQRAI